jgi:serine/threonine protein phosphatase PrpC
VASDLVLRAAGLTDVGRRRSSNEDVVLVRSDLFLYAVADGAGGHRSGEVASALAVRSLENYFGATVRRTHDQPEFDRFGMATGARRLSAAILKANADVIEIARATPEHRGMGTTIVAACFSPRSAMLHVGHAGDSRCYRLRGGHLEQLTQDHSLFTDVLEQRPELDDELLLRLPRNVVTRALGFDPKLRISLRSHAVVASDRFLLCSDGLTGMVETATIAEILSEQAAPEAIAHRLVSQANSNGGADNISVLVVECTDGPVTDYVPPPTTRELALGHEAEVGDPELLILGIEELDSLNPVSASDELLLALAGLVTRDSKKP